ncbi:hypothetical protein BDV93DRAFT_541080 [Ceratobasidium sp. AG-I]|nr:hypothetical protein BDV93DRAFT_541080 [Ceratobasidium sp. AG-I]
MHTNLIVARSPFNLLAPIENLPLEILSDIFLLAHPSCVHDFPSNHDLALLCVCRSWREIALGMPKLWSHIDLMFDGEHADAYFKRASVRIERSAGAVLHVDIRLPAISRGPVELLVSRMTTFLAQLSDRVECCAIGCDSPWNRGSLEQVLSAIINTNVFQTLDVLHVWSAKSSANSEWRWFPPPAHSGSPPSKNLDELLPVARALRSENLIAMADSRIYANLAELYIDFSKQVRQIKRVGIAWILASSPSLHVLSLINVDIYLEPGSYGPIPLDLRHLTLISSSWQTFPSLLSMLTPAEQLLDMTASVMPDPSYVDTMRSFLSRSNMTALDCIPSTHTMWFTSIPRLLPQLNRITFEHLDPHDLAWPTLLTDYGAHLPAESLQGPIYKITTRTHTYLYY